MSGFVAALKLFFVYGLNIRPQVTSPSVGNNMPDLVSHSLTMEESKKEDKTPYRPPHLRKKDLNIKWPKAQDSRISTDHETSTVDFTSSDSDYSDSDGSLKGPDCAQSSKVRVAAIVCLQVSTKHHML